MTEFEDFDHLIRAVYDLHTQSLEPAEIASELDIDVQDVYLCLTVYYRFKRLQR